MYKIALLLLFLGISHGQDATVGCYSEGECLRAGFVDSLARVSNAAECHELCLSTDGCQFFTYYGDATADVACYAYVDCPELSDAACNGCVSGEAACAVRGDCPPMPAEPDIVISGTLDCNTPFEGDTTGFPVDASLETCGVAELNRLPTMWIEFYDPDTEFTSITFDTCTTSFDNQFGIFQDSDCDGALECIDGDDDTCSHYGGGRVVMEEAGEGPYLVAVSGFYYDDDFGEFTLNARCE